MTWAGLLLLHLSARSGGVERLTSRIIPAGCGFTVYLYVVPMGTSRVVHGYGTPSAHPLSTMNLNVLSPDRLEKDSYFSSRNTSVNLQT